ncbi:MAG: DUF3791 domain-containing protein [Muribaculaceae bacterium]|nr:DUF3791 domain-containing protein [Muribaculaceae bacterium]
MKLEKNPENNDVWIVLDDMELKMGFLAQCVEELAEKESQDYLSVFERLENVKMTEDYILRHYNVLHTESIENITENLSQLLHKREKNL